MADGDSGEPSAASAASSEPAPVERTDTAAAADWDPDYIDPSSKPKPTTALGRLQHQLWFLLDDPGSSTAARLLSGVMMCIIMLSIVGFTFASRPAMMVWLDVWVNTTTGKVIPGSTDYFASVPGAHLNPSPRRVSSRIEDSRSPFAEIETFCIIIFTAEYFLRLFASPQGPGVWVYLIGPANLVDLLSILPYYIEKILNAFGGRESGLDVLSVLRLLRLTRITRIFKLSKNFQALTMLLRSLRKSGPALLMLFAFMAITGVLFATLIYTAEIGVYDEYRRQYVREDGSESPFESIPASIWWTIVTMTTVGYGDQVPVTAPGKVIAVLTMFCGLVVLSLPITIIGANFDDEYRELRKRAQDEKEKARRKERIHLANLRRQQQQQPPGANSKGAPVFKSTPLLSSTSASESPNARCQMQKPSDVVGGMGASSPSQREGTSPMMQPVTLSSSEDPIKLIQTMIHEAHYSLTQEVEKLMIEHENKLRLQIKQVLRRHAAHISDRPTPLEQLRPLPPREEG